MIGVNPDGTVVTKSSNLHENEKVDTRTLNMNNNSIYGVIRGKLKSQYEGATTPVAESKQSFNKENFVAALNQLQ